MFKMRISFIQSIGKLKIATVAKIKTNIAFKNKTFLLIKSLIYF